MRAVTPKVKKAFAPIVFDMGKPRVDLTKASALAAQLEDEELVGRHRATDDPPRHRPTTSRRNVSAGRGRP